MHYTLCDLLSDLTQNAVEASAKKITVELNETTENLCVQIQDNGKGMSEETLKKISDPFYTDGIKHPSRKIGMGIPFLIQTTTDIGGLYKIDSTIGKGTTVYAQFDLTNIDTPPIGEVALFFRQILLFSGDFELIIVRKLKSKRGNLDYSILRSELIDVLGGLEAVESLSLLGQYLQGLEEIE